MTTFREVWTSLQQPGQPLPFLLIDCAGITGGAAQISKYIFSEIQCLFVGNLAAGLADVAPYLGLIKSFDSDIARTVENLLAKHTSVLAVPKSKLSNSYDLSFSQIYRHFRKLNIIQSPRGEKLFFRYYDPRALQKVINIFDANQLNELFGPIDYFILYDAKNNIVTFKNKSDNS